MYHVETCHFVLRTIRTQGRGDSTTKDVYVLLSFCFCLFWNRKRNRCVGSRFLSAVFFQLEFSTRLVSSHRAITFAHMFVQIQSFAGDLAAFLLGVYWFNISFSSWDNMQRLGFLSIFLSLLLSCFFFFAHERVIIVDKNQRPPLALSRLDIILPKALSIPRGCSHSTIYGYIARCTSRFSESSPPYLSARMKNIYICIYTKRSASVMNTDGHAQVRRR